MRLTLDQYRAVVAGAKPKRRDPEGELQTICVSWFRSHPRFTRCQLISIPNEALRSPAVAAKLKRQGMLPGVADLLMLYPNALGHAPVWIELKAPGKTQSDKQLEFETRCQELGIAYYVIDSFARFEQLCYSFVAEKFSRRRA